MILDLLHFGLTVTDIDTSIDWYTRVLGLELVHRQRQDNPYTRTLVGVDEAVLEVAQLKLPNIDSPVSTHLVELIQYVSSGEPAGPLNVNRVGVSHLGLLVDDIFQRYERLLDLGVEFVNPPVAITEGANRGGFACYFHDPDGITIEFLQPPPERLGTARAIK